MNKNDYRLLYKNKRIELSAQEGENFNNSIYHELLAMDWTDVHCIHIYISIAKFKEPDTLRFISYLRSNYPNVNVVISKTDFVNNVMINYLWDDTLVLQESKWGILEPQGGQRIDESEIDVVLVPLLVADLKGNRVGYGKGFYDRFLSKCKPSVRKIGISFFDPVEPISDVDEWDIPLDMLVTPTGLFQFK